MARRWTPRERKAHVRRKYHRRSQQLLLFVLLVLLVISLLGIVLSNYVFFMPPQLLGVLLFSLALFILMFSVYKVPSIYSWILICAAIIVFASLVFLSLDILGAIGQLIWIIVISILFLVLFAILVFATELVWYEYQ